MATEQIQMVGINKKAKAMKRINRMFWATAAAFVAVACAKEAAQSPEVETGLVPMTFSASTDAGFETKTTYSGRNVYWEAEDEISLFSVGNEVVKSNFKADQVAEDGTWAAFSGVAAPGSSIYVAVYPHAEETVFDLATQTLTVNMPTNQTAVPQGFASGANLSAALSMPSALTETEEALNLLEFKNIGALLCISFETEEQAAATKSITIKAKKSDTEYWGITGTASVTYDATTMLPVSGEGTVDHVTLVAPEGGFKCKNGDTKIVYYAPVYPVGQCTGFEITFTDVNDKEWVKTNDMDAELKRNSLLNFGAVPYLYYTLPEEITLKLDFTSDTNPLGTFPKIANQTTEGETYSYTYNYEYEGQAKSETFNFTIIKGNTRDADGKTAYYQHIAPTGYANKVLLTVCNSGDTKIQLPAIPGRYLKSVSVGIMNTSNRRFRLQNKALSRYLSSTWVKVASVTEKATTSIEFPNTSTTFPTTSMGVGYYIQLTDKQNYYISDIEVVYTSTPPVAE